MPLSAISYAGHLVTAIVGANDGDDRSNACVMLFVATGAAVSRQERWSCECCWGLETAGEESDAEHQKDAQERRVQQSQYAQRPQQLVVPSGQDPVSMFDPATWGTAFPELYAWWTGVWCPWDGWVSGIRASKVVIACLSESLRMSLKFSCTVFGWRVCEVPMWPTGHAKNAKQKWTRRRAVARNRARMVVQRSRKTAGQFLPQYTWLIGQGS